MANLVLNESLGLTRPYISNVEANSPAAAVLRIHAWVIAATDETMRDMTGNDIASFEAIASITEATPYTNASLDETDIVITVNDTTNQFDIDIVDQTFTAVATQTAWTDITLSYDADGTDTDSGSEILWVLDFAVTPNDGDITVDFPVPSYSINQT